MEVPKIVYPEDEEKDGRLILKHSEDVRVTTKFMQKNLEIRTKGIMTSKAIYLNAAFTWVLGEDDLGLTVLIPRAD